MKVVIVADTHGNVPNFKKVVRWSNKEKITVILHAGDIGSPESFKESLADFIGQVIGVLGNMDKGLNFDLENYNFSSNIKVAEKTAEAELEGIKMAINHFPAEAKRLAMSGKYNLVFYGHTHRPWDEKIGNTHMINPGELAGQFYKPSFAIYDTETDNLELKILEKL